MTNPLIINVALTGCVAQKGDNPALPITPEEVAADARRCADEGAQVFHIHARDDHGNPAWGKNIYGTYIQAVRDAVPGAVVCASLSGRHFAHFEQRSAALQARPDLASLTLGSVDFQDGKTSVNSLDTIRGLLKLVDYWQVKPEFEVFDLGHCFRLQELAEEGNLSKPIYVNMIFGVLLPWDSVSTLIRYLPNDNDILWGMTALGRDAIQANGYAIWSGGHVRVGLEDSLWMTKDKPATNPRLVERVVGYARDVGREPATLDQAREMLGLGVGE